MTGRVTFGATLIAGKLTLDSDRRYRETVEGLRDGRYAVTIAREVRHRSQKQNAWHWAVAVPLIAHELGYDKDEHEEVHYALVSQCFGVTQDARTGLEVPNKRSSKLTVEEFKELMEWEQRWAAQKLSIVIPDPDPEWMFTQAEKVAR